MGFLERRLRKAALRGATQLHEVRIRFCTDRVAFEEDWPDPRLAEEQREWLEVYGACAYLLKQAFNLGPHGAMLWEPLAAGHPMTGEFVDDLTVVPKVATVLDTHFVQLYNKETGPPFIQTPTEGARAKHGQLAAASAVLLLDHVRHKSDRQEERMNAALDCMSDHAAAGRHSSAEPNASTVLPLLAMADLSERRLIADVYGLADQLRETS